MGAGSKAKDLFTDTDMSQKELCHKIGVSEAVLSNYFLEKNQISNKVLVKLADELMTTTDYLLGLTENSKRPFPLLKGETKLLEDYRSLSDPSKELLSGFIKVMLTQEGK